MTTDLVHVGDVPRVTPHDRCDACGFRAYVAVRLHSDGVLMFCGHHFRRHEPALMYLMRGIYDARSEIPGARPHAAPPPRPTTPSFGVGEGEGWRRP